MQRNMPPFLKSYGFSILLIISILIGALLGIIFQKDAAMFKPLGDICNDSTLASAAGYCTQPTGYLPR